MGERGSAVGMETGWVRLVVLLFEVKVVSGPFGVRLRTGRKWRVECSRRKVKMR